MTPDLQFRSSPHDRMPLRNGPWDRFLVRVLAPSLDRQLATGHPPRLSNALALRLQQIVSPAGRRELAQRWNDVMVAASRPPVPLTPRAPLCRGALVAADRDVREMIAVLTGDLPITASGAALASWLLSDGTGPLHNRLSPLDLGAVVRQATRQMDPFADTTADGADPEGAECRW